MMFIAETNKRNKLSVLEEFKYNVLYEQKRKIVDLVKNLYNQTFYGLNTKQVRKIKEFEKGLESKMGEI